MMQLKSQFASRRFDLWCRGIVQLVSSTIISICMVFVLLAGVSISNALDDPLSPEANGDNPLGIVIEPSAENPKGGENIEQMTKNKPGGYPDLGDSQVFPFVAGLDSYE